MNKYPLPNKNHEVVKDIETLQETFVAIDEDIIALENKTADVQEKVINANRAFVHTDISLANSVIQDIAPKRYVSISPDGIKCVDSSDNTGGQNRQCSVKKSDANFDVAWGDVWEVSKNGMTTLQNASEAGQNETHIFCDICEINNKEQLPKNNLVDTQVIGDYEIGSNEGVTLRDILEEIFDEEIIATRQNRGIVKIGDGVYVKDGIISADIIQKATKTEAGIVKIGDGIRIESETISIDGISQATKGKFGIVKLGNTLRINEQGAMEMKDMPTTIYDLGKIKTVTLGNVDLEEAIAHYRAFVNEDLVIKINLGFAARGDFSFVLELISDGTHLVSFTDAFDTKMQLMPVNRGTTRLRITKRLGIPYYNVVVDRADAPQSVNLVASREAICEDYIVWAPRGSNWNISNILRDYYDDGYSNTTELCFEFTKLVCVDFVKYRSRTSTTPMGEFILKGSNDGRNWTTLLYRNNEIIYGEVKTDVKGCFRFYHLFIGYTSDDNKPAGVSLWGTEIKDNDLSELKILTPYMNSDETAFAKLTASNITEGSASNLTDNDCSSYMEIKPGAGDTGRWVKYELTEPAAANILEIDMNFNENSWGYSGVCQTNWFKLEGSNDDENWDLLLERQYHGNEVFLQNNLLFYHLNNETEYKYYRLSCIATNSSDDRWQLCGLKLYQYKYRESRLHFRSIMPLMFSVSQDGYEISASSEAGGGETVLQAFDGNLETQWTTTGGEAVGSWVHVKLPTATICRQLLITARNNQWFYQAPTNFEIRASNDGGTWTTLSEESDLVWEQGEQKSFFFANETAYLYYGIYINAVQEGDYAGLAQLEFGNTVFEYKRHLKKYDYLVPVLNSSEEATYEGIYKLTSSTEHNDHKRFYLFDRSFDTRFELFGETDGWVQVELPVAKIANLFSIGSRSDSWCDAAPRDYSLFASNNETDWITLFSVSDSGTFSRSELRTHEISTSAAYKYYRLNISNSARTVLTFAQWNLVFKHEIQEY